MGKMKRLAVVIGCAAALLIGSLPVSAAQVRTTDSFTHRDTGSGGVQAVAMPDVFRVSAVVDSRSLGLKDNYGDISDIACNEAGHVFILSEDGIVVEFDDNNRLVKVHTIVDADGNEISFTGAQGLYVNGNELYVADTLGGRVLCSENGVLKKEIFVPESALIPSDFVFSPTKIEKDSKGYLYVISKGSYYGAVMYDKNGEFMGFYGANTVKSSVLSTLASLWDTLTQNDIKRAKKVKNLPFQFVDICIDKDDFIYTCTGLTADQNTAGQVRMLSPGGTNILFKRQYDGNRVSASAFNFGEDDYAKRLNIPIEQGFESVAVDANGYIYALDVTYGLIYVYDTDCNLISAFGGGYGQGTQDGLFIDPVAMEVVGNKIYVADVQRGSVTVFQKTAFGKTLMEAQKLTLRSKYSESEELWDQVLKEDAHNQLAIRTKAKIAFIRGDYDSALALAEEGMDFGVYGQALGQLQTAFINKNFTWLFLGALVLIAGLIALVIVLKEKQIRLVRNEKMRCMLNCFIHPFESFNAIRYRDKGSLPIAVTLTGLFFVSGVLKVLESNFRYSGFDPSSFNALFEILKTVGLIVLWSLANWAISVLLQGIGKFRHVFIVTAYSVLPLIITNLISIPLSHLLTSSSSVLLSGMELVAMIWVGVALSVGLMVVHDFSFPRYAASVMIGLAFMFLIVFIIFVFGILMSQFGSFIGTLFMEFVYR